MALIAVVTVAACSAPAGLSPSAAEPSAAGSPTPPPSSGNQTAPPASAPTLPTFEVWAPTEGPEVGCDTIGVDNPVFGLLRGDAASVPFPVWLESPNGEKLFVVWPAGFTVRFDPDAVLMSETGLTVARDGHAVALQVSRAEAAGTEQDPYFADGILTAGPGLTLDTLAGATFTGCYPRRPGYASSAGADRVRSADAVIVD